MEYVEFYRHDYILHYTFSPDSLDCIYILHFEIRRNVSTTCYILHFQHLPNSSNTYCILHFRHLPNSSTTYCILHFQYSSNSHQHTTFHDIFILWSLAGIGCIKIECMEAFLAASADIESATPASAWNPAVWNSVRSSQVKSCQVKSKVKSRGCVITLPGLGIFFFVSKKPKSLNDEYNLFNIFWTTLRIQLKLSDHFFLFIYPIVQFLLLNAHEKDRNYFSQLFSFIFTK